MNIALFLIAGIIIAVVVLIPVFKIVSQIYPYAYTNARIRSMNTSLLSSEDYDNLVRRPYNDIVYSLERKKFTNLTKYLKGDFSYGSIDQALRSELVGKLGKIKKISPDHSKKFLSVLLSKYDIQIIESIVRSLNTNINDKEDVLHITEVFSDEFLSKKEHDLEGLQNELKGTMYEPVLERHLNELEKRKFDDFEYDLDLLFFKRLKYHASTTEAKKYVKQIIDIHNVSLALKGIEKKIPGGRIKPEGLVESDLNNVLKTLNKYNYKLKAESEAEVERELQLKLKKLGEHLMSKNPLSDSTIIGHIILQTVNTRNINILLKMKYNNFPEEEIRRVIAA